MIINSAMAMGELHAHFLFFFVIFEYNVEVFII